MLSSLNAFADGQILLDTDNCETVTAWVEANSDHLPTTLTEIRTFPTSYQRSIFRKLPADTKVSLWREKLEETIGQLNLSPQQQAVLAEGFSAISASDYQPRSLGQMQKFLVLRMQAVFTGDELRVIVGSLENAQLSINNLKGGEMAKATGQTCDCLLPGPSPGQTPADGILPDCKYGSSEFCVSSVACTTAEYGCGILWLMPCTGTCQFVDWTHPKKKKPKKLTK